jgi:type I restriction enzyme, S subunit
VSFPAYPSYRQDGIEWLGDVPSAWFVRRFRFVFRESGEKIEAEVVGPMLSVSGYRGIEVKEYDDENRKRLEDELVGYRIVRSGQLVVNTMWLNYAGLGVSAHEGHVSPAYRSYWIGPEADGRFIHHLMRSSVYVQGYTRLLTGIRPNSLQMSRDDLMDFPVLLPPMQDQVAIAAFLDRETAKIDALVEEQRRLIELLKEKRQAVISYAVTKGLTPDVPMKDSGVEWLGDVPAHWRVVPLRYVARVQTGVAKGKDLEGQSTKTVPYLRVANVQDGHIDLTDVAEIQIAERDLSRYLLRRGDVLMNEGGDFDKLGRGDIWQGQIDPCIHQNHVFAVRPTGVSAEWLNLVTSSSYAQYHFMSRSKQSTNLASISSRNVMDLPVVLPPPSEQSSIVERVGEIALKLAEMREAAEGAVTLLQERRAALISAAVTGKIDVRGTVTQRAEAA